MHYFPGSYGFHYLFQCKLDYEIPPNGKLLLASELELNISITSTKTVLCTGCSTTLKKITRNCHCTQKPLVFHREDLWLVFEAAHIKLKVLILL